MAKINLEKQINQYDKILKENMEIALPGLIKNVLKIDVVQAEDLAETLQYTKERKPDVLKKILDKKGKTFVLHIEFQTMDDPDMAYRMAEYAVMVARKYRLPLSQYVIYIGEGKSKMKSVLNIGMCTFSHHQISLSSIGYEVFLASKHPEEKILAISANFGKEDPKIVFEKIVSGVMQDIDGELERGRRKNQLRVLSQLRTLVFENLSIMEHLSSFFKLENDVCYRVGEMKGEAKGEENKGVEVVKNMLAANQFTVSQIANFAGVTEAFVRKVQKAMK